MRAGADAASAAAPVAPPRAALTHSRGIVLRLTALFSLDSFGGGFVVNAILVLWLLQRHALSLEAAGAAMSAAALLSALSQLASAPLARRIGLIRTMVFTHLPANFVPDRRGLRAERRRRRRVPAARARRSRRWTCRRARPT